MCTYILFIVFSSLEPSKYDETTNSKKSPNDTLSLRNPLFDGKFFQLCVPQIGAQDDNNTKDELELQTKCQLCLPKIQIIKGSKNSTGNFLRHLKM